MESKKSCCQAFFPCFQRKLNGKDKEGVSSSSSRAAAAAVAVAATTPETAKSTNSSATLALKRMQSTSPGKAWLYSFQRRDPRFQILKCFESISPSHSTKVENVFTVWRPTSAIAIQRMIKGEARGKGLEIKGKSSKAGRLSGYVPYLQIYEEKHKSKVMTKPRNGRTRIFFRTVKARDAAVAELEPLQDTVLNAVHQAKRALKKTAMSGFISPIKSTMGMASDLAESAVKTTGMDTVATTLWDTAYAAASTVALHVTPIGYVAETASSGFKTSATKMRGSVEERMKQFEERQGILKRLLLDMDDPSIRKIDDYAPACYGMELPDRLLWKGFIDDKDISRPEGTEYYTGRPSEPAFQDMNCMAVYNTRKNNVSSDGGGRRVVLWQVFDHDDNNTTTTGEGTCMDARGLIMAYEEHGTVLPCVSDFDCFTIGTRGVEFAELPKEQVELLQWCVSQTETILEHNQHDDKTPWTKAWLNVLKQSASRGFHPSIPEYGFGDERSYSIIEHAVYELKDSGAVRHGPECFNYYFPQDLDEEFLIVSGSLPNVSWRYVGEDELRTFLHTKIDEGFEFPVNPKWILCDKGWKSIYDRLLASGSKYVWFPNEVRERIESIYAKYPQDFLFTGKRDLEHTGTAAMDLATLELHRYLVLCRARAKLYTFVKFNYLLVSVRRKRTASTSASAKEESEPLNSEDYSDSDDELSDKGTTTTTKVS